MFHSYFGKDLKVIPHENLKTGHYIINPILSSEKYTLNVSWFVFRFQFFLVYHAERTIYILILEFSNA